MSSDFFNPITDHQVYGLDTTTEQLWPYNYRIV